MNKYLIALDLDGTLLNSKKEISFITKHYLRKLAKKGHIIVIASGRPFRSIKKYYEDLKLDSPLICYNGSLLFDPKNENFPSHRSMMSLSTIQSLYKDLLGEYAESVTSESDDTIYSSVVDETIGRYFSTLGMKIKEGTFDEILNEDVWTAIFKRTDHSLDDEIVKKVNKYPDVQVRFWGDRSPYYELYPTGVSKGDRVIEVANFYNIPKERVIAFGDADNDIDMMQKAGIGVCMKNGYPSSQKEADIITKKDNDHNGIAHTLKQLIK